MKISTSATNLPSKICYPFKPFSILNFAMMKCFWGLTCFFKVFLLLLSSLKQFHDIFIIKKLFYNVVHASGEML